MSPSPEGWGIYCFGADPVCVGVGISPLFVSVHYILIQIMDFDQTCIDTLLGGIEDLIRF